ncbi:T9SS type A sorting domain-containing protein [Chitinophaga rhizophila]|uniref:T9SS type A sorting domain-containing protein n=1 Tax=Chitinophaga rhizophila TaxID=2866212 RepID=A0ABS7G829_9BACT|nr:T9SS type A sorting domain-containing protein [Chitinophaga rhizophila]MBW8683799.1 T9SS type A sorting domain-containing protein [Chitinophaga rhizophila]
MSKMLKYIAGTSMALLAVTVASAQQKEPYRLGTPAGILQDIRTQAAKPHARLVSAAELKVGPGIVLTGKVNTRHTDGKTMESVIGEIENTPGSSFFLQVKDGKVTGNIVLRNSKKGYKYYTDNTGTAFVKEVALDSLLCIDYNKAPEETAGRVATGNAGALALPELQSRPGANGVVLLDFDGQYVSGTLWNGGNPINAAPTTLTEAQQLEVWELVSEDFRPFNLNITNSEAVYNSYPANRRMRCILTPTNTAAPGAGGVAYVGSFNWGNETPCWVFNGGVKGAGEAASHEVGHTFGLSHDGRTSPSEGYYAGHGTWAPIMGVGYYVPVSQWSKGEYASANQTEDDLAKIASATYGVGYRTDDAGGSTGTAALLSISTSGAVNTNGVIERTGDVDFYSFTTAGGAVSLNFATPTRHANLDILATLYNSSGGVVASSNPTGLSASISATVAAGTYYVAVTGTGYLNPLNTGYSNYGSLGSYAITGSVSSASGAAATVYKDCDYGGYAVTLGTGTYTLSQLQARGVVNDDISSLKVANGYEALLYQHDNFGGDVYLFRGDFACLVNLSVNGAPLNLNDWTSSVEIRPSTAAAARTKEVLPYIEKVTTAEPAESKLNATLNVMPNPFVNEVVVRTTATTKEGYLYVTVFSLDGKTILQPKRIVNGERIDLSKVGAGIYLIKIFNGKETEIRKIIKQ